MKNNVSVTEELENLIEAKKIMPTYNNTKTIENEK